MSYFNNKSMMKLQLGCWQDERPLKAYERERELLRQVHQPNCKPMTVAPAGWRLFGWLRRRIT